MRSANVRSASDLGRMMNRADIFPSLLILLDIGAAVVYGVSGDWRRCVYWIAAAVLTATVTY